MANDIGNITASLKLESAAFIREMTRASQATARSSAAMQASMAKLGAGFNAAATKLKTFVAAYAGLAGLRAVKQIVGAADELGDAATRLGVGAQELQRFRYAAEQAGVAAGGMDSALKLFSRNLAQGKLDVAGATLGDKFKNFIDQVARAPTAADQTVIAMKGLNKQFDVALQIAREGPEAFRKWFDSATVYSLEALETADKLDKQFRAIEQAVTVGFGTGLLQGFNATLDLTEQDFKEIENAARLVGAEIRTFAKDVMEMARSIKAVATEALDFFNKSQEAAARGRATGLMGGKGGLVARPPDMGGPPGPGAPGAAAYGLAPGGAAGPMAGLADATTAVTEFGDAALAAASKTSSWKTTVDDLVTSQVHLGEALGSAAIGPLEQYRLEVEALSRAQEYGKITAEQMGAAQTMAAASAVQPWLGVAATVAGALGTLFDDNKAVAIAQAVINTAQAVTAALAQYPPPLSFAMAAAQAAAGAAQIATIKSTRPGSSGSAKRPSAGGGSGKAVNKEAGSDETVRLTIVGDTFGKDHIVKVARGLVEYQKDGGKLIIR